METQNCLQTIETCSSHTIILKKISHYSTDFFSLMLTSNKSNIYYPHKYIHSHKSILNLFHLQNEALICINLERRQKRIKYFRLGERKSQTDKHSSEYVNLTEDPGQKSHHVFAMLCWKKELTGRLWGQAKVPWFLQPHSRNGSGIQ